MSNLDLTVYGGVKGSPHYNEPEWKVCESCDGKGYNIWSCCGDDITNNDIDLCPTCYEHCGDEKEECTECNGEGTINIEI